MKRFTSPLVALSAALLLSLCSTDALFARSHTGAKKTSAKHSRSARAKQTKKQRQSRKHTTLRAARHSSQDVASTATEGTSTLPSLIQSVMGHGKNLLGLRYRTTGVAQWPLDCSGFVSYIYSLEGIKIPRSSSTLATYTTQISVPQPGDLLFFKGRNSSSNRVGHVALVVSNKGGNIRMMHSSSSKGIVIESLNNSPYYTTRYLGAGRIPQLASVWKGHTDGLSSDALPLQ